MNSDRQQRSTPADSTAPNMTLVFHHVPKTGGSTLRSILRKEYGKIFTLDWNDPQSSITEFEKLDKLHQNGFDVIQGHAALQLCKYIDHPVLLTYLRDPIDLFISQFYFIKRSPEHRSYKALAAIDTIGEYVDFAVMHDEDNLQTRFLSDSAMSYFGALKPGDAGQDRSRLLREAKARLASFNYVFFTHQFDLSLLLLKKDLAWKHTPFYVRMNATNHRPPAAGLSGAVLEKIRDAVRYDIELCEFATSVNEKLLSDYDPGEELPQFRKHNRLMGPVTRAGTYMNFMHSKLRRLLTK